jgi:hypothetical protein
MANYLDPYAAELQGIQRQQKLAEMLMNQQQPQEQMVSGRVAPINPLQAFLPALNTYQGMNLQKNAEADTKKLADLVRGERQKEITTIASQMYGSPDYKPAISSNEVDINGDVIPTNQAQVGIAPDYRQALAGILKSDNPAAHQFLPQVMAKLSNDPIYKELSQGASLVGIDKSGKVSTIATNEKHEKESPEIELAKSLNPSLPRDSKNWTPEQATLAKNEILAFTQAKRPITNNNTVINNTDKKQIFELMKDAKTVAQGSIQQIDAANNIINALDTNKVFTGTGANVRLEGARIADSLGISGKDTKEKLANTGTTIKSLASLALQGAQLMSGQGAITQGERQLASDAMSGRIDFTPAELRQLANAAKRSGEFIYNNYESQLKSMSQDPDFKKVMPYYQVPRMPQQANPNQLFNAADKIINGG